MNCEESYNTVVQAFEQAVEISIKLVDAEVEKETILKKIRENDRKIPGPMRLEEVIAQRRETSRVSTETVYEYQELQRKLRWMRNELANAVVPLRSFTFADGHAIRVRKDLYVVPVEPSEVSQYGLLLPCTADGTILTPPYYTLGELCRERREQESIPQPSPEPEFFIRLDDGLDVDGE